jgi:hypothetical protein
MSMGGEEFQIVVRKPLSDLEAELRSRYRIEGHPLNSTFIEDGTVVFVFGDPGKVGDPPERVPRLARGGRRRHGRRRRTKTRGWKPVATIVNSLGQRVRVYDVFVRALRDQKLSRTEQRKLVEGLVRANGNEPSRDQIDYFLGNTLEYLRSQHPKEDAK